MAAPIKIEVRLAKALKRIEADINEIVKITDEAMSNPDTRLVDLFKDIYNSSLMESAEIVDALGPQVADKIRTLALVLYVKDMETIGPVSDWRQYVNTRPVEAIRTLRTDIRKLDVKEAKMVIDAYRIKPF